MALAGWNENNVYKMTIDGTKIDGDLTDFPVLISLSSGTGITGFDATAVFDELEPDTISGTAVSGTYDSYTKLMLHMDGDASDSQHTITSNGNPQLVSIGKFNGSMYFDGTGDYLSIADSDDFYFDTGDFTIDFWFKPDSTTAYDTFVGQFIDNSNLWKFDLGGSATHPRFSSADGGDLTELYVTDVQTFTNGTWYHLALLRSSGVIYIFKNGVSLSLTTNLGSPSDSIPNLNTDLVIGQDSLNAGRDIDGYVDELRISKGIARTTLSGSVPTEPYTTDSGTVLLMHFDGDQSESQHDITFNGDPQIYSSEGKFNGSYYFDGTGDYVSIADHVDLDFGTTSNDYTVDFWVKTASTGNYIFSRAAGGYADFSLQVYTSTEVRLLIDDGTDTGYALLLATSGANISDDVWHHVAIVRYGGTTDIYIDGISKATSATSYSVIFSSAFEIGYSSVYGNGITGYVDEFRISKGIARWTSDFIPPTGPYGSSWDNRKKLAMTTNVSSPGIYDPWTKLLLNMDGDQSDSQHTVTVNGDPQLYATGKFNGSMYFDGTGDYLTVPDSDDWDFGTGDFTIDFWARFENTSATKALVGQGNSGNERWKLQWSSSLPGLVFQSVIAGVSDSSSSDSWTPTIGQWYYIATVRSGTNAYFYVDGESIGSDTITDSISKDGDLTIATGLNSGGSLSLMFNGYIDELRISKGIARTTLSGSVPTEPYTTDSGTVLLMHFDGDWSDSEHITTFNGDPQITVSGTYFDGTGDYLSMADSNDWTWSGDFTIDLWINTSTYSLDTRNRRIISMGYTTSIDIEIQASSSGKIQLETIDGNIVSDSIVADGTWYHIAIVRNGTVLTLYVDGVESGTPLSSSSTFNAAGFRIGHYYNESTGRYVGYIDELRISKGIARWTSNFTVPDRPIAASIGELQLPVEIERWDSLNNQAWLWTKVPTISSGTSQDLYLYYDVTHSGSPYVGDTGDVIAQSVWDNNYVGVWHMGQDPATNDTFDSTSNTHDGTPGGSMTSADLIDGNIGKALDFDGSDDYLSASDSTDWDIAADTTDYTIDLWIKHADHVGQEVYVAQRQDGTHTWYFEHLHGSGLRFLVYDAATIIDTGYGGEITDTSWHHIALVKEGTTYTIYKDGVSVATTTDSSTANFTGSLIIGDVDPGVVYPFEGYIDETRIAKGVSRSTAWINADIYSGQDNLITYSLGAETILFIFSSPDPDHLSTVYGTSRTLMLTTTVTGADTPYIYDAKFYDGGDNQIGSTVSGINSGAAATSATALSTPAATTYSWYVVSTASGSSDTSQTYSFTNKFLAEGYTEINATRASGVPVRLYRRSTGVLVSGTVSTGVSGTFSMVTPYNEAHYAIALHPTDSGTNALIYDWITP